ncbi:MAG: hypothetical protein AAFP76_11925 [Bacteroidota bacterium]
MKKEKGEDILQRLIEKGLLKRREDISKLSNLVEEELEDKKEDGFVLTPYW